MHGKRSGAMEVLLLSNLCRCCPANQRINGQERAKRRATLLVGFWFSSRFFHSHLTEPSPQVRSFFPELGILTD
ncbi:hypothetical protein EJB05_24634 [Eragrostis curvula]|uniref:Uncharacterized protein n=1 Tax=Eragrostis curvula TaxID=38414 RepID=A0A5J9VBK5_9POAL|nr:hypothetical protein EJB05_24634 [Eragrostis curvula]